VTFYVRHDNTPNPSGLKYIKLEHYEYSQMITAYVYVNGTHSSRYALQYDSMILRAQENDYRDEKSIIERGK